MNKPAAGPDGAWHALLIETVATAVIVFFAVLPGFVQVYRAGREIEESWPAPEPLPRSACRSTTLR